MQLLRRPGTWRWSLGGAALLLGLLSGCAADPGASCTASGTGNINATGNNLANRLIGNSRANTLNGKGGNDTLIGSAGNDRRFHDGSIPQQPANRDWFSRPCPQPFVC